MTKKKAVPFWLLPGSWGLKGLTRSRAEAEYYYEGEELDRKLASIESDDEVQLRRRNLEIDRKYGLIDDYNFRRKLIDLEVSDEKDRQLLYLALDYEFNKLNKNEYEKHAATVKGEPYVGVMSSEFDPKLNVNGMYFELDWNDAFIEMLNEAGYTGLTPEQVVNRWFDDLCRSIADNAEEVEIPAGPIQQVRRDDGRTEYS